MTHLCVKSSINEFLAFLLHIMALEESLTTTHQRPGSEMFIAHLSAKTRCYIYVQLLKSLA